MKNKQFLKKLESKAKKLWQMACLERWGNLCECCGQTASAFHHFLPKSRSNHLRYDVKNGVPLCRECHYTIHFSHDTLKRRGVENAIIDNRGTEWLEYIEAGSRVRINKNKMWLEEQIARLTEQ